MCHLQMALGTCVCVCAEISVVADVETKNHFLLPLSAT